MHDVAEVVETGAWGQLCQLLSCVLAPDVEKTIVLDLCSETAGLKDALTFDGLFLEEVVRHILYPRLSIALRWQ